MNIESLNFPFVSWLFRIFHQYSLQMIAWLCVVPMAILIIKFCVFWFYFSSVFGFMYAHKSPPHNQNILRAILWFWICVYMNILRSKYIYIKNTKFPWFRKCHRWCEWAVQTYRESCSILIKPAKMVAPVEITKKHRSLRRPILMPQWPK